VAVIEGADLVSLSMVVVAETFHVLTRHYAVPRAKAVDGLTDLVRRANIRTLEVPRQRMMDALALCRPSGRVSIPDALLWARAIEENAEVITFDKRFPTSGIQVTVL
jgi:predicted nucleic acid-binding protein